MNDAIDGLINAFTNFEPFRKGSTQQDACQILHGIRTFPHASDYYVLLAADAIKRYVEGLGPHNEEDQKRRCHSALDLMLDTSTMQIHKSRVLASVIKQAIQQFWMCNEKWAAYFYDAVVQRILRAFDKLWSVRTSDL